MRSVTEQLEFYEDIFGDGAPETAATRKHVVEWIAELRHFIESEFRPSEIFGQDNKGRRLAMDAAYNDALAFVLR
jgi:hypothetical protein